MTETKDTTFFAMKLLEFQTAEDPLLAMIEWMTNQLMELEIEQKCNAAKGVHGNARTAYRSGYRPRRFDTRLGTLYMLVPKLRNGGYVPFFVTERKRSEQALIEIIKEAWINGVSTRKIDHLAKAMGIENITASQVSNITSELDSQVEEFRNSPLDGEYPVIWVDALYEKIRDDRKVISVAIMVVRAVDLEGKVRIIAVEPMYNESEATYTALFDKLRDRGLEKVWLVVSGCPQGTPICYRQVLFGSFLATVQGALHAQHPGPCCIQGKGRVCQAAEAGLETEGCQTCRGLCQGY